MQNINKSYFQKRYFEQKHSKLSCVYSHDDETECYQLFENDIKTDLAISELKYGTAWLTFYNSQQDNYVVNELYSRLERFIELSECLELSQIQKYLNAYYNLVEYHPFFLMYFGLVYSYLHKLTTEADFSIEKQNLCRYLKELQTAYLEQIDYIKATLVEPYQHSSTACTGKSVATYERLLCNSGKGSIYLSDGLHIEPLSLGGIVDDYTFSEEFILGIDYFIENNLILRQCPVCTGYFKTKCTLDTTYCNRMYKGNTTCQSIGAHMNYKEKMKQDVIYSEYRRFYYKLHSQIRRGTLDKNSAYFDELKELQTLYNDKYINAPDNQKEYVLEEFKKKISALYE